MTRATAALLALVAMLSGCGLNMAPGKYLINVKENSPAVISEAFADAATFAVLGDAYRLSYVQTRGFPGRPLPPPTTPTCTPASLDGWRSDLNSCVLLRPEFVEGCENVQGCAAFRVQPSLWDSAAHRALLEATLRSPCADLLDPFAKPNREVRFHQSGGLHLTIHNSWSILRCSSRHPIGAASIAYDPARERLTVQF